MYYILVIREVGQEADDAILPRHVGNVHREGGLWRDALQEQAVVAILLALLADDGGDEPGRVGGAVVCEEDVGVLQRAENDGSESLGQEDGIIEGRDGELVLAG